MLAAAGLAALLLLALGLRLRHLELAQGTLSGDEARLTLVAHGILEHGWPVLPSGHIYTRGLTEAYLTALSVAALGPGDLAPRLPSVLSGVLLVLLMYLYGAGLGGRAAGLLAAALAATYAPFVFWSRQAWFYSTFLLLWVLVLYCLDRAVTRGSRRALLAGAMATVLSFFTHELAVLLLPAVGFFLLWSLRGTPVSAHRRGAALAATGVTGLGLLLLATTTLLLRSDTLAGSLGEVDEYVGVVGDLDGLQFYRHMLTDQYWPLALVALAGLVLADAGRRRRLLPLVLALLPLWLVAGAILRPPPLERYGLALMPLLFLLGAAGMATLIDRVGRWLPRGLAALAMAALAIVCLWPQRDLHSTIERTEIDSEVGAWIGELQTHGYQPGDLVLTDVSTEVFLYLGRTDFWIRSRGFEKYVYRPDGLRRDIHTGAPLVKTVDDFEQLVRAPNRGRTAWVIGSNRRWQWQSATDRDLREYFDAQAAERLRPADNTRLYKLLL